MVNLSLSEFEYRSTWRRTGQNSPLLDAFFTLLCQLVHSIILIRCTCARRSDCQDEQGIAPILQASRVDRQGQNQLQVNLGSKCHSEAVHRIPKGYARGMQFYVVSRGISWRFLRQFGVSVESWIRWTGVSQATVQGTGFQAEGTAWKFWQQVSLGKLVSWL